MSNVFLYREFRDVSSDGKPVITRALRVMMSEKPLDPDFFTPWQNPKKLATSISGKNVITVDISADAFNSNLDAAMASGRSSSWSTPRRRQPPAGLD
jgi:hypothetical protein